MPTHAEDYPLNYDKDTYVTHATRRLNSVTLAGQTVAIPHRDKLYNDIADDHFIVHAGDVLKPSFAFSEDWMNGYVYIDYDKNGQFDVKEPNADGTLTADNELVSYSFYTVNGTRRNSAGDALSTSNTINMPTFTIPATLAPGTYKIRFKVDWNCIDPGGATVAGNDIIGNGGAVADVNLVVVAPGELIKATLTDQSEGGHLTLHDGTCFETGVDVGLQEPQTLLAYPDEGYKLTGLEIVNDKGTTSIDLSEFDLNKINLAGSLITTNTTVRALFAPLGDYEKPTNRQWKLVFNDDFDQPDYSKPSAELWQVQSRENATWNRFVSNHDSVGYVRNGALVCRAIPNPDRTTDSAEMLTGAFNTRSLFYFNYGRVEARLKTIKHTGNFPAFWMMPQTNTGGWPNAGEIDIFETIDSQDRAWHTVHSRWHNVTGKGNPAKGSNESVTVDDWHIYALEWDSLQLRWYVDDKQVFSYNRLRTTEAEDGLQWPYDKPFYIIINQSVGNGSWAANCDATFTYETEFDWVRVYQREYIDASVAASYPVNYDRDQRVMHSWRRLHAITLGDRTIDVPNEERFYNDVSDTCFVADAGEEVSVQFSYDGTWMNAYVYLDRDGDGNFNLRGLPSLGVLPEGSELMGYSFYCENVETDTLGYNSAGKALRGDARNTLDVPSFTIPADLASGIYQMRFKVDWNSLSTSGSTKYGNDIITNGGAIFDVPIRINGEDITGINALSQNKPAAGSAIYDLSGRRVKKPAAGIYIVNGKKVMLR